MLLAIDTSTNYACLALADGDTLLAELNWRVGRQHGSETLDRIRALLRDQRATMSQLDGIAVALGPGSFNGVRVAVAIAKSLSFALGAPLYGIPTLDMIAWGARLSANPIWALIDAGRGEIYAARFDPARAEASATLAWGPELSDPGVETGGYEILTPEALARRVGGALTVTGEWRPAMQNALADALGDRARFTPPIESRRGAWLAELAAQRMNRGEASEVTALEPLYLRRPNITTSKRMPSAPVADRTGGEESAHAL